MCTTTGEIVKLRINDEPTTKAVCNGATLQHMGPQNCNNVGVHTDLGGVPFMEDDHCVHTTNHYALFCVYDGHGGADAARFCRYHLHLNIVDSLHLGKAPNDALREGFARTEADLLREQKEQPAHVATGSNALGGDLCGSTALVVLMRQDSLHLAWLGDCRAVLCRGGVAIELTRDHVLSGGINCAAECTRVLDEGGWIEGGRLWGILEVARAFGDLDQRTGCKPTGLSGAPELRSQLLQPDDEFLLLGSDGLWQRLDSQMAVSVARADLRAHTNAAMAAEKLVEAALKRKADDNITAMVVVLRPVEPSARQRPRLPLMKRATGLPAALPEASV